MKVKKSNQLFLKVNCTILLIISILQAQPLTDNRPQLVKDRNPYMECVFWDEFEGYVDDVDFLTKNSFQNVNPFHNVNNPNGRRWELYLPGELGQSNGPPNASMKCDECARTGKPYDRYIYGTNNYGTQNGDFKYYDILSEVTTGKYLRLSAFNNDPTPKYCDPSNGCGNISQTSVSTSAITEWDKHHLPNNDGRFGYWEIKFRLNFNLNNITSTQGIAPNFWLWPEGDDHNFVNSNGVIGCWSEIDIFETKGYENWINPPRQNGVGGNIHFTRDDYTTSNCVEDEFIYRLFDQNVYIDYNPNNNNSGINNPVPQHIQDQVSIVDYHNETVIPYAYNPMKHFIEDNNWHIFGMEWTPTYIAWYYDGVLFDWACNEYPNRHYNFSHMDLFKPMHIMIDLGIAMVETTGPDEVKSWTEFPYHYDIDYVRVYQNDYNQNPTVLNTSSITPPILGDMLGYHKEIKIDHTTLSNFVHFSSIDTWGIQAKDQITFDIGLPDGSNTIIAAPVVPEPRQIISLTTGCPFSWDDEN